MHRAWEEGEPGWGEKVSREAERPSQNCRGPPRQGRTQWPNYGSWELEFRMTFSLRWGWDQTVPTPDAVKSDAIKAPGSPCFRLNLQRPGTEGQRGEVPVRKTRTLELRSAFHSLSFVVSKRRFYLFAFLTAVGRFVPSQEAKVPRPTISPDLSLSHCIDVRRGLPPNLPSHPPLPAIRNLVAKWPS